MFIGKDKLLLSFFYHKVALVTASKDIKTPIIAIVGKVVPISKPITIMAPKKPNMTPIHCLAETFSFNSGPAKALVKTGFRVTIKAAMPVGKPLDIEKKLLLNKDHEIRLHLELIQLHFFLLLIFFRFLQ